MFRVQYNGEERSCMTISEVIIKNKPQFFKSMVDSVKTSVKICFNPSIVHTVTIYNIFEKKSTFTYPFATWFDELLYFKSRGF